MANFTNTFGNTTTTPADVSIRTIQLVGSSPTPEQSLSPLQLYWPFAPSPFATNEVTADIIRVRALSAGLEIWMPDTSTASVGIKVRFINIGDFSFVVKTFEGDSSIQTINIPAMQTNSAYDIDLAFKTNAADRHGTWDVVALGIDNYPDFTTAAGYGITAFDISTVNKLSTQIAQQIKTDTYNILSSDRASLLIFKGTTPKNFYLPVQTVIPDPALGNGFWFCVQNLTPVDPNGPDLTIIPGAGVIIDGFNQNIVLPPYSTSFFMFDGVAAWSTLSNIQGIVFFDNGSFSEPSITFKADITTGGFYIPAGLIDADTVGFGITARGIQLAQFINVNGGLNALNLRNSVLQIEGVNSTSLLYTLIP